MDDILWTKRARRNLHDIGEYIAQDDPAAAARTVQRIVERVLGLTFYPRIGREGSVEGTRELVITGTPYIAVYRIGARVEVLRTRHGAQRWPDGHLGPLVPTWTESGVPDCLKHSPYPETMSELANKVFEPSGCQICEKEISLSLYLVVVFLLPTTKNKALVLIISVMGN